MTTVKKQYILTSIILRIVTFDIYNILWYYRLVYNTRVVQKQDTNCAGELLCILFVPFYSLYWWYTRGNAVKSALDEQGCPTTGDGLIYLLLNLFTSDIITMAMMQYDFNRLPQGDMPSEGKKTVAIVIAVIAFILICAVGFFVLSAFEKGIRTKGYINLAEEYLVNNEEFVSEYGSIKSVSKDPFYDSPMGTKSERIVPCIVKLENGERYSVWVKIIWGKNGEDDTYSIMSVRALE